jgi:8-oxo-dGTP pyrophosphatase MutT (NUDIX family)
MGVDPSAKFLQPSRLSKGRQQVAAVCYRIRKRGIEFLLVQTRGGRWIFPKGGVEPGLTHAQSAALEAFEEAGVHGRMEEIPFARYFRRKPDTAIFTKDARPAARSFHPELGVTAHLCEVSRLEPPQESNRNPTWFSAEKAKQRLLEDRAPEFSVELARVVDRALLRIQRLHSGAPNPPIRMPRDALQRVRFEAFEDGRGHGDLRRAALARHFLRQRGDAHSSAAIEAAAQAHFRQVHQIGAPEEIRRPVLRLGTGAGSPAETAHNITAIDSGRSANLSKSGSLASSKHKVSSKLAGGRAQKS